MTRTDRAASCSAYPTQHSRYSASSMMTWQICCSKADSSVIRTSAWLVMLSALCARLMRRSRSSPRSRSIAMPTTLAAVCRKLTSSGVNVRRCRLWAPSEPYGSSADVMATLIALAAGAPSALVSGTKRVSAAVSSTITGPGDRIAYPDCEPGRSTVVLPTSPLSQPTPARSRSASPSGSISAILQYSTPRPRATRAVASFSRSVNGDRRNACCANSAVSAWRRAT